MTTRLAPATLAATAFALAIALGGCSSDDDSDGDGPIPAVEDGVGGVGEAPSEGAPADGTPAALIVGSWSSTDGASQCAETYTFEPDGTYRYTGLDAIESGNYSVVPRAPNTELMLEVTADNGLAGCDGLSLDITGIVIGTAVAFPDEDTMVFGFVEDGDELTTFTRQ